MTATPHHPESGATGGARAARTLLQEMEERRAYGRSHGHLAQRVSGALETDSPPEEALIEAVSALLVFMYGDGFQPRGLHGSETAGLLTAPFDISGGFMMATHYGTSSDRAIGWLETLWRRAPERAVAIFDRLASGGVLARSIVACRSAFPDDPAGGHELLLLLLRASKRQPPERWLRRWGALRERLDGARLRALLLRLAALEAVRLDAWGPQAGDPSMLVARGALWALADYPDDEVRNQLAETVRTWARSGQGTPALGMAAVWALARPADEEAARRLADLRRQIAHRTLRARIEEALAAIAAASGLSPEELADRQVPDLDLDRHGERSWDLEGYRVTLRIASDGSVERAIVDPAGRTRKSLPGSVRSSNADTWDAIARESKALKATLSAQRGRLEEAMISGRTWTASGWRDTFGRNPVLASLARRLVWQIHAPASDSRSFLMPGDGGWIDVNGHRVGIPRDALLSLAHPLSMPGDAQVAWQRRAVEERVVQPFKQLFRETYVVTPAEEESGFASARFAGLPVPMSQIYALTRSRGWSGPLGQIFFDGAGQGWREFPGYGVRAVLRHSVDVHTVTTVETVLFERKAPPSDRGRPAWQPISLRDVPAIPFSEAMRDVDLIVSLGSAGTEAQWQEWEAAREAGRAHWFQQQAEYARSWKEMSESRAALLAQLLPGLGLSERVTIRGHFALVKGRKHEYRVHLGTGNIHLEPSGRYLCVVPARERDRIFLPFEEDDLKTSEVISKLILLAADDSIEDPRILQQLGGG